MSDTPAASEARPAPEPTDSPTFREATTAALEYRRDNRAPALAGEAFMAGVSWTIERAAHAHARRAARPATDEYMNATPRYARRDTESLAEFYMAHLDAMTREGLHDKGAIAAELAWRDSLLAAATARVRELEGEREAIAKVAYAARLYREREITAHQLDEAIDLWNETKDGAL